MKEVKTITSKEYKKLSSIEWQAKKYANSLKDRRLADSIKLGRMRRQWSDYANSLGIVLDYYDVAYKTECGKDYSHGYNFGDSLA